MSRTAANQVIEPARAYEGRWQALVLTPDLASQQSFIVGVVVHEHGRLDGFRVLHDFRKLECIYGPGFGENLGLLLDRVGHALGDAARKRARVPDVRTISPQLALTEPLFGSGDSPDDVVRRMYHRAVILEPRAEPKARVFESRDQGQVRLAVHNLLKQKLALDADRVIKPHGLPVAVDGKRRQVDVDIFTGDKGVCAVVTSGWYASRETIELHALRGFQDLHAAHHYYHARRSRLLVVTPIGGLPPKIKLQVDTLLDKQEHKARASGLEFAAPSSDEEAADLVAEMIGQ